MTFLALVMLGRNTRPFASRVFSLPGACHHHKRSIVLDCQGRRYWHANAGCLEHTRRSLSTVHHESGAVAIWAAFHRKERPIHLRSCLMVSQFNGSSLLEAWQADSSGRQDLVPVSEARPRIPIEPRSSPLLRPVHHPEAYGP
jgi:hypothetical protein